MSSIAFLSLDCRTKPCLSNISNIALRSQNENFIHIKFFDDDSKEWVRVTDFKRVKKYSCKDKKKLIRKGMRTLAESRSSLGLGVNLQLAQFYKDVELAEVMTDNDQEVGDILAQYEVTVEQQEVEDVEDRRQKSDKRKDKEKEKDVLREVKNGRVGKTRGKTKKSTRKL